jgi:hypothetical protein
MQRDAFEKAKDRLTSAKARLKDLEASKDYDSSRRHWYDFLISSNAIFSVLEQGAKGNNSSQSWFGRKKGERRTDPLLSYLHHARNADEHNVPSVTELDRQKVVMVENGKPIAEIRNVVGNKGTFFSLTDEASPNLTKINEMRVYPDRAKLIRVRDRGVDYDAPSAHLGSLISEVSPIAVARLMVQYLEAMIAECETFIPKN